MVNFYRLAFEILSKYSAPAIKSVIKAYHKVIKDQSATAAKGSSSG